jgi:hypothetical protein
MPNALAIADVLFCGGGGEKVADFRPLPKSGIRKTQLTVPGGELNPHSSVPG